MTCESHPPFSYLIRCSDEVSINLGISLVLFRVIYKSDYIEELRGRPNVCGTFARYTITSSIEVPQI